MREQLVAMFAKQRTLFAKLGAQPPAGPMAAPDNSVVRWRSWCLLMVTGSCLL